MAILGTLPFLLAAIALFFHGAPVLRTVFREHLWGLPCFLLALIALVPAHELIHALAYGSDLRSPKLWAGVWLQRGVTYVLYDEPLPRRRVLFMLAAPFLTLSVLPGMIATLLRGPWQLCVIFFGLLHAALCVGDVGTFLRLICQTPHDARIHNHGWTTYWTDSEDAHIA